MSCTRSKWMDRSGNGIMLSTHDGSASGYSCLAVNKTATSPKSFCYELVTTREELRHVLCHRVVSIEYQVFKVLY
jgi:hypothetical protein